MQQKRRLWIRALSYLQLLFSTAQCIVHTIYQCLFINFFWRRCVGSANEPLCVPSEFAVRFAEQTNTHHIWFKYVRRTKYFLSHSMWNAISTIYSYLDGSDIILPFYLFLALSIPFVQLTLQSTLHTTVEFKCGAATTGNLHWDHCNKYT